MAYDEELADRIRDLTVDAPDITERKMFGGLAFLAGGAMAVAASGQGGLMVRADPAEVPRLLTRAGVHPVEMRGRTMKGWLRVDPEQLRSKRQLTTWVKRGLAEARAQPTKRR